MSLRLKLSDTGVYEPALALSLSIYCEATAAVLHDLRDGKGLGCKV